MTVQAYMIQLVNGAVVMTSEPYDLPIEKGLIGKYKSAGNDDILEVTDGWGEICHIPKKHILYIRTGDVKGE